MQDLEFAAKSFQASGGISRQPPTFDAFSRTQVPCFLWVVLAFSLGEAAVLHFGGFAADRDGIGGALQTAGIPIGFPSQKWFLSLLIARHRAQPARATHLKCWKNLRYPSRQATLQLPSSETMSPRGLLIASQSATAAISHITT